MERRLLNLCHQLFLDFVGKLIGGVQSFLDIGTLHDGVEVLFQAACVPARRRSTVAHRCHRAANPMLASIAYHNGCAGNVIVNRRAGAGWEITAGCDPLCLGFGRGEPLDEDPCRQFLLLCGDRNHHVATIDVLHRVWRGVRNCGNAPNIWVCLLLSVLPW